MSPWRVDAGRADRDEIYVWWAKIRSKNRDGRLPHHAEVLALDEQARAGTETGNRTEPSLAKW
jgi:hypothetical protein